MAFASEQFMTMAKQTQPQPSLMPTTPQSEANKKPGFSTSVYTLPLQNPVFTTQPFYNYKIQTLTTETLDQIQYLSTLRSQLSETQWNRLIEVVESGNEDGIKLCLSELGEDYDTFREKFGKWNEGAGLSSLDENEEGELDTGTLTTTIATTASVNQGQDFISEKLNKLGILDQQGDVASSGLGTTTTGSDEFTTTTSTEDQEQSALFNIHARVVPSEIHVGLADRPKEMAQLMQDHSDFFSMMRSSVFMDEKEFWEDFVRNVLLADRMELDDLLWMRSIKDKLQGQEALLVTFESLVGFVEPTHDNLLWDEGYFDPARYYASVEQEMSMAAEEQPHAHDEEIVAKLFEPTSLKPFYPEAVAEAPSILPMEEDVEQLEEKFDHDAATAESAFDTSLVTDVSSSSMMEAEEKKLEEEPLLAPAPATLSSSPTKTTFVPAITVSFGVYVAARHDPDTPMISLETQHPLFFNLISNHLKSPEAYKKFLDLFTAPAEVVADDIWLHLLCSLFLRGSKARKLRQMLRQVVNAVKKGEAEGAESDDDAYNGEFYVPARHQSDLKTRVQQWCAEHNATDLQNLLFDDATYTSMTDTEWIHAVTTAFEGIESNIYASSSLYGQFVRACGVHLIRHRHRSVSSLSGSPSSGTGFRPRHGRTESMASNVTSASTSIGTKEEWCRVAKEFEFWDVLRGVCAPDWEKMVFPKLVRAVILWREDLRRDESVSSFYFLFHLF